MVEKFVGDKPNIVTVSGVHRQIKFNSNYLRLSVLLMDDTFQKEL